MSKKTTLLQSIAAVLAVAVLSVAAVPPDHGQLRAEAKRLFAAGNYKEALEKFRADEGVAFSEVVPSDGK